MAKTTLPTHPTTGLRAIYVSPKTGRAWWPILGGSEPAGEPAGGGDPQGGGDDLSWDSLRSAWEESGLTPGQIKGRLDASRKWESRAKSAPSADELAALRAKAEKHDALELELSSEAEKQARAAREEAAREADAKYQPQLVQTAFEIAIGDRKTADEISDFLGDLNLTRFINDQGQVDTAKVLARVAQFAPATGTSTTQQPRGPIVTPHTPPGQPPVKPGDSARKALAERGIQI